LANGLNEPQMKPARMCLVAGVYAVFQTLMPLTGWFLVTKAVEWFSAIQAAVPWIALILLLFIGGKMLIEGLKHNKSEEHEPFVLGAGLLLLQGISTSIDALSVGFTIEQYPVEMALVAAFIIGAVTFVICLGGLAIGKKVGTSLSGKASILGGVILIGIGIEIFLSNLLS
ncbi:MAG: manganese efflux pump, partial [Lachnospiraceae bacterium]|nr:manganese efflux pump [Lachnospiraceae bacterium]